MRKKILIGSIIAVSIIVLSSFSSVVGKVSTDNDLVEFDVEFCGLGKKHTVKLTQEEAYELELLIDEIKKNPNMLRDYLSEKISKGVSLQNILRIVFLLIGLFFIYAILMVFIAIVVILRGRPPAPPL